MKSANPRLIVFTAFDGMRVLDLTGPLDAFAFTNDLREPGTRAPYMLRVVSEAGGPLQTSSGLVIATESLASLDDAEIDTLIAPGGAAALRRGSPPEAAKAWLAGHARLVSWIAERGPRIRRVCSVCTGTFLLAAAGQLAGHVVATHWASAELLAECFPGIRVEPDRIFV